MNKWWAKSYSRAAIGTGTYKREVFRKEAWPTTILNYKGIIYDT